MSVKEELQEKREKNEKGEKERRKGRERGGGREEAGQKKKEGMFGIINTREANLHTVDHNPITKHYGGEILSPFLRDKRKYALIAIYSLTEM